MLVHLAFYRAEGGTCGIPSTTMGEKFGKKKRGPTASSGSERTPAAKRTKNTRRKSRGRSLIPIPPPQADIVSSASIAAEEEEENAASASASASASFFAPALANADLPKETSASSATKDTVCYVRARMNVLYPYSSPSVCVVHSQYRQDRAHATTRVCIQLTQSMHRSYWHVVFLLLLQVYIVPVEYIVA